MLDAVALVVLVVLVVLAVVLAVVARRQRRHGAASVDPYPKGKGVEEREQDRR